MNKWYAIKRPDGTFIMGGLGETLEAAHHLLGLMVNGEE